MSAPPKSGDEPPAWLVRRLESLKNRPATESTAPPRTVQDLRGSDAWSLALDAALTSSFLPNQLGPKDLQGEARETAEGSVLAFATPVLDEQGVRWRLNHAARAGVLDASSMDERDEAAARTAGRFDDTVSAALRELTSQVAHMPGHEGLDRLEARRVAVTMLRGTRGLDLPQLEDIERRVQLQRLLAGFERMTGRRTDLEGGREDRFFGREKDMTRLREHVDTVPTGNLLEQARRVGRSLQRRILGVQPLVVWGTGGVGKTTLMSKFMLEHAQAASGRYPFAYLDFERSTVSARDRPGMLIEMSRQVACQFGEIADALKQLVQDLGASARRVGGKGASGSEIAVFQRRFRDLIDDHLVSQERLLSFSRPFLLVFDTFEVVQYSEEDVKALEQFVADFARSDERSLWPRLRIVISGRKRVKNFLGEVQEHELGPIDPAGATRMLVAQAADLGIVLPRGDADELCRALARAGGSPKTGVHPLRLRLVGEIMKHAREEATAGGNRLDGVRLARDLAADLERPDSEITGALVNGILVRRVLDHLVDPDVRALTDPGMVVRLITPDVIQSVLAPCTARPMDSVRDHSDNPVGEPWVIGREEAQRIYAAFAREVTLVEGDGEALRFRQDVRQEMIPIIRRRRPNRFRDLHEAAWRYFSARATENPTDLASAAEAVYHALWLDQPLEVVDQSWRRDPAFQPKIEPEEFESSSHAPVYLAAKMGGPLTPREIGVLGPSLALEWLEARTDRLLQGTPTNETLAVVRAATGADLVSLAKKRTLPLAARTARLCIRTGDWDETQAIAWTLLGGGGLFEIENDDCVSLLRSMVTVASKRILGSVSGKIPLGLDRVNWRDPVVPIEILAHVALSTTPREWRWGDMRNWLESVDRTRWLEEPRVLRLAILTGARDPTLRRLYFESLQNFPREERIQKAVTRVLRISYGEAAERLGGPWGDLNSESAETVAWFAKVDELFNGNRQPLLAAAERDDLAADFQEIIAADHWDWIWPMQCALDRWLRGDQDRVRELLDRQGLRLSWAKERMPSRATGADVVEAAFESGQFLALARGLSHESRPEVADVFNQDAYPSDIQGIASSLIDWDRRCRAAVGKPFDPGPEREATITLAG